MDLDALVHNGRYRASRRMTIADISGEATASLSLVPRIMVDRCLTAMHRARPLDVAQTRAALARAARAFGTETIEGLSPDDYQRTVSRVSGLPISIVRGATQAIMHAAAAAYETTQHARPVSAVNDWHALPARSGRAVWTRRGSVLAVNAAGNHPGVHSLWLEALALGYRVAVRPSTREPFTPHRLVSALRASGFADDQVALLPTDHTVVDDFVNGADLAMVYGGDDVMRRYAGHPTVLPQGPGRSKVLVDSNWPAHLDTIVASVGDHGGAACINATAVFVIGDATPVARAIAERLAAIPSLPPDDDKAQLPVLAVADARQIEKLLLAHARGTRPWLGGDGIVDLLDERRAVLRPAVFQLDHADAPQARVELGFPCVWVAPWSPDSGMKAMQDTLVLTAIVDDEALIDRFIEDPTISNVYMGDCPTCWFQSDIPHDRYLAEFLMRTKGVVRR